MKKRIITLFVVAVMLASSAATVSARVGDVIGMACYTDVIAMINGYELQSYNVNGYTYIVVEDLRNFSFNVDWNQGQRTLSVSRNWNDNSVHSNYKKGAVSRNMVGVKSHNLLSTDIQTYINGQWVPSYNIDGQTIIQIDNLSAFGNVIWEPSSRTISVDISWLQQKLDFGSYIGEWDTYSNHLAKYVDARIKIISADRVNKVVDIAYKVDTDSTSFWAADDVKTIDDYSYKNLRLNYQHKTLSNGKAAIATDTFELLDDDTVTMILDEDGKIGLGNRYSQAINREFK